MKPTENQYYEEKIASNRTEALFLLLTAVFFALLWARLSAGRADALAAVFSVLGVLFLFYSINYRTLLVRAASAALELKFGVFSWKIPFENIRSGRLDDSLPPLLKYGGAGIHFFFADSRYRASFNFLEYPRVVIRLKQKAWLVEEVSFTTRRPEEVLRIIQERITESSAA